MIKTQPFNCVECVYCVGESNELHSDQGVISTSIVNVALCLQAATNERREQWAGAELHNVAVVD